MATVPNPVFRPRVRTAQSVVTQLRNQELGLNRNNGRSSLQMLRSVIKGPDRQFQKVWEAESKEPIYFQDHKIFLNQFRKVFGVWGVDSKPMVQYLHPEKVTQDEMKTEDVIVWTQKVNRTPKPGHLFAPLLIKLTKSNRLFRCNATTGETMDMLSLGTLFKYINMSWNMTGESLVLQSTYFMKNKSHVTDVLQSVAFVGVNPFRFQGMMELTVEMLGSEAKSTSVSEDILIVGCGAKKTIKLYSMLAILSSDCSDRLCTCDFGQTCGSSDFSHGPIGAEGIGIPITVKVRPNSMPPVLFVVQTADNSVAFGGFPMHFVHKPPVNKSKVHVKNLMTRQITSELEIASDASSSDTCVFHEDESGRILLTKANSVHVLKFFQYRKCKVKDDISQPLPSIVSQHETEMATALGTDFILTPEPEYRLVKEEKISPNRTSRPRRSVPTHSYAEFSRPLRSVFCVEYENETDFLSVLGVSLKDSSSSISIFENSDGSLVKRIPVPDIREDDRHQLVVDLDTAVLITISPSQKYHIAVYQLTRDVASMVSKPWRKAPGGLKFREWDLVYDESSVSNNTRSKDYKR